MVTSFADVPSSTLWVALACCAALLAASILAVGGRYWWVSIAMPAVCSLVGVLKGLSTHKTVSTALVIAMIGMLSLAAGFLVQIRTLRSAYAEDPRRPLDQLFDPEQGRKFVRTIMIVGAVLFTAACVCLGGFVDPKHS